MPDPLDKRLAIDKLRIPPCDGCQRGIPIDWKGDHCEPRAWDGFNDRITPCLARPCSAWVSLGGDDWQLRAGLYLASANDETGGWVVLLSLDVGKFGKPLEGHVFGSLVGTDPVNAIIESGAIGGRIAAEDAISPRCREPLAILDRR